MTDSTYLSELVLEGEGETFKFSQGQLIRSKLKSNYAVPYRRWEDYISFGFIWKPDFLFSFLQWKGYKRNQDFGVVGGGGSRER